MTRQRTARVVAGAGAWWGLMTAALWVGGRLLGQSASLSGCALGALLIIAVGEIGDRVRTAWKTARRRRG
ncbi:hypothetical protein [Streptomyces yangpuensis]|uniref:hypothetical protein n=1 Tax=Streptomyces yangpuensis TaxID=1648182 RepID=UPI00381122CB